MRPFRFLLVAGLIAAPALAQTGTSLSGSGTGGTSGNLSGGLSGGGASFGRIPAPLGSSTTLSERIDGAAGLNTTRARGGSSLPSTVRGGANVSGSGVGALSTDRAIDAAGRPAGTPFGSGGGGF